MAEDPARAAQQSVVTPLPRIEDLPVVERGLDEQRVREAFDAFRRHVVQLQAQLRVLKAAGRTADVEPTGHALRMDALHLVRQAAEFADVIERDAQRASASQLRRAEAEIRKRQEELGQHEAEVERFRRESERLRAETLNAARDEARQLLTDANREASQERREAEARAARLVEQSRHQATELTNTVRAEVEQTLEWARAQAATVMARAQQGAEQLLAAAGLGEPAVTEVVEAIMRGIEREQPAPASQGAAPRVSRPTSAPPPTSPSQPDREDGGDATPA
jgi:F0F1-type ATP synthase membrane subunit b/b'